VICLDLRGLTFIDSTGARTMWNMHRTAESHGRRLVYASPNHGCIRCSSCSASLSYSTSRLDSLAT
jgi:STAS domain